MMNSAFTKIVFTFVAALVFAFVPNFAFAKRDGGSHSGGRAPAVKKPQPSVSSGLASCTLPISWQSKNSV